jgi:acyl-coenzyme A thioesterase PaaI-like protein
VLRITRSRSSSSIEVLVPATTARAIYANAVGAVRIWVVTDSHTRFLRRVRRGRPVVVTGSLVAQRSLRATYAIPVDAVVGR